MLRISTRTDADSTIRYYTRSGPGTWGGQLAKEFGLEGSVATPDFSALAYNRSPRTGERVTQRDKSNRRVGFDFNFNAPKSVSITYALTKDPRILDAFRLAMNEAMAEIEHAAMTRIRAHGSADIDRPTGNLAWASYIHYTTRPVEGVADPHLHSHCFVFNMTFDKTEKRSKALQVGPLKQSAPYFQSVFHDRLAAHLNKAGYRTYRKGLAFEIEGVPSHVLETFSRRTKAIQRAADKLGVTSDAQRALIGARIREPKAAEWSEERMEELWKNTLSAEDRRRIENLRSSPHIVGPLGSKDPELIAQALEYARDKAFERLSVVTEHQLLTAARQWSMGRIDPDALREAVRADMLVIEREDQTGQRLFTTQAILAEEKALIAWVRDGQNTCSPLHLTGGTQSRDDSEIDRAVKHLLTSRDRVTGIHGKSGAGKTTLLQTVIPAIRATGTPVAILAPLANASRGTLREAGFTDADTLERFLITPTSQQAVKNGVIVLDEAGLASIRDLSRLAECAKQLNARVILVGDTRQHRSVDRGDAFRTLIKHGGLHIAHLNDIKRQDGLYREAVDHLSEHRLRDAFQTLDNMNAFVEGDPEELRRQLAEEYLTHRAAGERVHIVSPTHAEGRAITAVVRDQLLQSGGIHSERLLPALRRVDIYKADRHRADTYKPGWVLECVHRSEGFAKGERLLVTAVHDDHLAAQTTSGQQTRVELRNDITRFRAYERTELPVGIGDRLRITVNGRTTHHTPIHSSTVHIVESFTPEGDLALADGRVLSKHFAHIDHGWCGTSYAAQSMTVDRVFIAESSESFPAASREQLYVSASRGRVHVRIYTESKDALLDAVNVSSQRLAAIELEHHPPPPLRDRLGEMNIEPMPERVNRALRAQTNHQIQTFYPRENANSQSDRDRVDPNV